MFKRFGSFACALVVGTALLPAVARADDPRDSGMRSAEARARDSAETKRLNQGQLAYVSRRDAKTLQAYRGAKNAGDSAYAAARADYERKLAVWRRAVDACNAGHWDYCDR